MSPRGKIDRRKVATAQLIATLAHDGQKDKNGDPYILHPAQVAEFVREAGHTTHAIMIAWLHDTIEDTWLTYEDLTAVFLPPVPQAVLRLTRLDDQTPEEYYAGVKASPLALVVKEADIRHNTEPERLRRLDKPTRLRLKAKYSKARYLLGLPLDPYLEEVEDGV